MDAEQWAYDLGYTFARHGLPLEALKLSFLTDREQDRFREGLEARPHYLADLD